MPAQAGIHGYRSHRLPWPPAFAGATKVDRLAERSLSLYAKEVLPVVKGWGAPAAAGLARSGAYQQNGRRQA